MMQVKSMSNNSSTEYAGAFWRNVLRCDGAYDEYVLKRFFIEGLVEWIWRSMHFIGARKTTLQYMIWRNMRLHNQFIA